MSIYITGRGTPMRDGPPSNAGHMWFSISEDGTTQRSYGFAPATHGAAVGGGQVYDNDIDNYLVVDYQKSIFITQSQYNALKSFGDNPSSRGFSMAYDVLQNSCIDFAYKALSIVSDTLGGYNGSLVPSWNIQDQKLRAVIEDLKIRNAVDPQDPSHGDPDSVSTVVVSVDGDAANVLLGHSFDPTNLVDVAYIEEAIQNGTLDAFTDYSSDEGRYTSPFGEVDPNSIILSSGGTESTITILQDGSIEHLVLTNDDGSGLEWIVDLSNEHPYSELEVTKDSTGKITNAQVTLDPAVVVAGSVGQVFGSAIGRALAPNDPFVQLAAGTVAGAIGQTFGQVLRPRRCRGRPDI